MQHDLDLSGMYDLHVHTSPDIRPRLLNDLEAARQSMAAGMAGILLKSHITLTADRAVLAEAAVPGSRVYGSLVLNQFTGGLNPAAVDAALQMGAKQIYMPTVSAANHRIHTNASGGIDLSDPSAESLLREILALIKERGAILGTGHISRAEIRLIVRIGTQLGLEKIVITHPEHPFVTLTAGEQRELAGKGVYFERCFASTFKELGDVPVEQIAREIRDVGVASTVLTTDLGAAGYPAPTEGMRAFLAGLRTCGIEDNEIDVMTKQNPAELLSQ